MLTTFRGIERTMYTQKRDRKNIIVSSLEMKWSDLATRSLCSFSYNISINASDLIRRNSAYMISNKIIATSHCLICIQPLPPIILAGLIYHGGDNNPLKQPCIHTRIRIPP